MPTSFRALLNILFYLINNPPPPLLDQHGEREVLPVHLVLAALPAPHWHLQFVHLDFPCPEPGKSRAICARSIGQYINSSNFTQLSPFPAFRHPHCPHTKRIGKIRPQWPLPRRRHGAASDHDELRSHRQFNARFAPLESISARWAQKKSLGNSLSLCEIQHWSREKWRRKWAENWAKIPRKSNGEDIANEMTGTGVNGSRKCQCRRQMGK